MIENVLMCGKIHNSLKWQILSLLGHFSDGGSADSAVD